MQTHVDHLVEMERVGVGMVEKCDWGWERDFPMLLFYC